MPEILTRFLRVQPGEGRKVLQFALLGALLQAGLATGMSAADSLFLIKIGADKLPVVYLLTPAMMLGYIPAFAWLLGRYHIDRVFDLTKAAQVWEKSKAAQAWEKSENEDLGGRSFAWRTWIRLA